MKYKLVDALNAEGMPVALDGRKIGRAHTFISPSDTLVLRVNKKITSEEMQTLANSLHQSLQMPVLIVDDTVDVLVLRFTPGTVLKHLRQKLLSWVAGISALWFTTRAKFALRFPKA